MRKVTREAEPESLKKYAVQWTNELLAEIEKSGDYAKVADSYKTKYNQKDVKEALRRMYKNHCCYCEGLLDTQTYGRIEHLRPKSLPQFYDQTFEWNNMHWCCEICNTNKNAKWNDDAPILDPAEDDVDKYLYFNRDTAEYEPIADQARAKTTINDAGLNRPKLVEARRRIVVKLVKMYGCMKSERLKRVFLEELIKTCEEDSYPSVIESVVEELLRI